MEKTISVRRTSITFSLWDLGGQREFVNMLPLVCNDAVAILFMFDLSRKSTLNSVKEWYRQARGFNKVSTPSSVSASIPLSWDWRTVFLLQYVLRSPARRCVSLSWHTARQKFDVTCKPLMQSRAVYVSSHLRCGCDLSSSCAADLQIQQ